MSCDRGHQNELVGGANPKHLTGGDDEGRTGDASPVSATVAVRLVIVLDCRLWQCMIFICPPKSTHTPNGTLINLYAAAMFINCVQLTYTDHIIPSVL